MPSKEVRDPVHGLIVLSPDEWRIVDSRAFQRLRGVQQLAMTHLVYPGARHTRFEHCIGACHIADRLAKQLKLKDARLVRLAALLHDIGHGPFSHVSEFVFEEFAEEEHVHEKISAAIVLSDEEIRNVLGEDSANWIAELLSGTGHGARRSLERDIIAGPADIDKLDYLLRDSHYCGVNYGRYDLAKVIEAARLVRKTDGEWLAYHEDGVFALEEMLLARYHMHRQVYGHKTRVATDRMLVRAMKHGVKEGVLPLTVFAPSNRDAAFVNEYVEWDDYRVIDELSNADGSVGGKIMRSLKRRRLLKRVARITFDDLLGAKGFDRVLAGEAIDPKPNVLKSEQDKAEQIVADVAGVDPIWTIIHWEKLQSPISTQESFRVLDKEVLVTDDAGKLHNFSEVSEIFRATPGTPAGQSVSVYVRLPDGVEEFTAAKRRQIRAATIEALRDVGQAGQAV